jgi:hypothetical protein
VLAPLHPRVLRPNSWTKFRQKSKEASSLIFTVTSTALHRDLYFFELTQPLPFSVKRKGRKPDKKPYPLSYGLRNPYRNLKSENSQEYAQKPQGSCAFMNSASGVASPAPPPLIHQKPGISSPDKSKLCPMHQPQMRQIQKKMAGNSGQATAVALGRDKYDYKIIHFKQL